MATISAKATLSISSPAFKQEAYIPRKYTCEGKDINPPINIEGTPEDTVSLALIVDDPDAPGGTFDHWIAWNIHPADVIDEDSLPGITGKNSRGEYKYMGPCPPSGTHRYFFKVYALDTLLDLDTDASKEMVEQAIQNHVIAYGELMGLYKKQN